MKSTINNIIELINELNIKSIATSRSRGLCTTHFDNGFKISWRNQEELLKLLKEKYK